MRFIVDTATTTYDLQSSERVKKLAAMGFTFEESKYGFRKTNKIELEFASLDHLMSFINDCGSPAEIHSRKPALIFIMDHEVEDV